ncbi:thrombospondin type 1 domain protein [Necator americanus]|uniref:Thrombospondin type 1 domain protein n=1 Tax=Necator americanus TaxID=51031 RepID=W2TY32_NECAM|nr:thrombospondin type 1 domain protein [Necator americanus]ETN86753.1 thrombospondin type 1 domain protein [Necator americanus]
MRCSSNTWGDWLPCSVSCGIGFQIRERLCDGNLCTIVSKQARTCNEQPCPANSRDFEWENWSDWTECSQTCGEGFQSKERSCKKGHCPSSDSLRQRRCVPGPCPVWDDWSEWSECSSCSRYHMRTRSRQCILHSSSSSANCEGESRVEESCDLWCGLAGLSNVHPEIELITGKGRRRVCFNKTRARNNLER